MKEYTSCFVGIPLPERYQDEFEDLLKNIKAVDPTIETTYPLAPHITVCYLDEQPQGVLPDIAEVVRRFLPILQGVVIEVGGLGYFKGEDPKVMFLNVKCPEQVETFSKKLAEDLAVYSETENNLPFHPHMTVAWLPTPEAKKAYWDNQDKLGELMDTRWSFDLTEVCLYGVDSTKQPQFQEKLIPISLSEDFIS